MGAFVRNNHYFAVKLDDIEFAMVVPFSQSGVTNFIVDNVPNCEFLYGMGNKGQFRLKGTDEEVREGLKKVRRLGRGKVRFALLYKATDLEMICLTREMRDE